MRYHASYAAGKAQLPLTQLEQILQTHGGMRKKDYDNYWRGFFNQRTPHRRATTLTYKDLPLIDNYANPNTRFVPVSASKIPLIPWAEEQLTLEDALTYPNRYWVSENLKDTNLCVIDVDGDHADRIDLTILSAFSAYLDETCAHTSATKVIDVAPDSTDALWQLDLPVSYHLTFTTDRYIPTMHFKSFDVLGNANNVLRCFKDKRYNGLKPMPMTQDIYQEILGIADPYYGG